MISVVTNYLAMNAGRQFNIVSKDKNKSVERLSSGYKINRAADDAAGLSISEKLRNQIRNLNQACDNIQDGISLVHTADGVFEEITSITHRMEELFVQAANDTNDADDRKAIDAEIQELKEEISDTLFRASFNNKKLFNEPYIPEVWGQPATEQIQVFNDGLGGYGGISINNIRYTWSELGVSFHSDGSYATDTLYPTWGLRDTITDPVTGETINLYFKEGDQPPMAIREYHWEADDTGIYVNKVLASKWEDLKGGFDKDNPKTGIYSFDYQGMTVRFATKEGDDFNTIKNSLNGQNYDSFQSEMHWNAEAICSFNEHAVDIMNPTESVIIHEYENKNNIKVYSVNGIFKSDYMDVKNFYELRATADGVQLVDVANNGHNHYSTVNPHTLMTWDQFSDVSGSVPLTDKTNNGYPIVDWGKTNQPNNKANITLDDKAVYRYTDEYTGISFDFKLSDEISREQIEAGMTLKLGTIKTRLSAPIETVSSNPSVVPIITNMPYDFMLNAGRDFDNPVHLFNTTQSFKKTSTTEYTYTYSFPNGLNMSGNVSADTIQRNIWDIEYNNTSININLKCNQYGNGISDGTIKYNVASFGSVYNRSRLSNANTTSKYAQSNMTNYLYSMTSGKAYSDITNLTNSVNSAIADLNRRITDDDNAAADAKLPTDVRNALTTQLNSYNQIGKKLTTITNNYNAMNDAAAISAMHAANQIYDKIIVKYGNYTDTNNSLTAPNADYNAFTSTRNTAYSNFETQIGNIYSLLEDCTSLAGNIDQGISGKLTNLCSTYRNISNYKTNIGSIESEQMNYCRQLKSYRDSYVSTLNNTKLTTDCKDYARVSIYDLDDNYTSSVHTIFDATFDDVLPRQKCYIQSGANEGEDTMLEWETLNLTRLGLGGASAISRQQSVVSIVRVKRALSIINRNRSLFGAYENRLMSQYDNNRNYSENMDMSESKLRDTDMAEEMTNYAKHQIIQNAGQAMLSQANQQKNLVLELLKQ